MARFYLAAKNDGKSNATTVHRLAQTRGHVLAGTLNSGAVHVEVYRDENDVDCVKIVHQAWKGSNHGVTVLYDGPMAKLGTRGGL